MPVFKDKKNGKWFVMSRYTDWQGNRKQKCKRGFSTKREAQAWERIFQLQSSSDMDMTSIMRICSHQSRSKWQTGLKMKGV